MTRLYGLPPIVGPRTRVLILGSFPGVASLRAQQYYAHPHNQFWRILQAIWPSDALLAYADSYEKRSKWLLDHGLGVWDVYASCERDGSLDSAIRNPEVNDFAALKARCPQLRLIVHNGGESFKHAKLVRESLGLSAAGPSQGAKAPLGGSAAREAASVGVQSQHFPLVKLPSTSPANASWSFERKLAAWRQAMVHAGLA